jgi:hypothetical protein
MDRCRHCRHGRHDGDCQLAGCGCVKFEPVDTARCEARKRLWIVRASFLIRRGWTRKQEVHVRAAGLTGAVMLGTREARRAALPRGTRVAQVQLTVLPVPRSARS